ncbi:MAG: (Fe-S)-binding protein [Pseudomonadota bacterium]
MSTALQGAAQTASKKPSQVYFFATCVIDMFSPQSGLDAVDLIERAGIKVLFPLKQSCCGQPAYTTGFSSEARLVAAAQLDLFPSPWPVVVPSGSCGGMLRHHWPKLFADDPVRLEKARDIAARTVEFSEFMVNTLELDLSGANAEPVTVAVHTSCTARREMDNHHHVRRLLKQLPGVEVLVQEHESECCGFGGTFSVKHPEISCAMARDKVDAITATGCNALISADCGCLLNLNGNLEKRADVLRGEHVATFIRKRLDHSSGSSACLEASK